VDYEKDSRQRGRGLCRAILWMGWAVAAWSCTTRAPLGVERRLVEGDGKGASYTLTQLAVFPYGSSEGQIGLFQAPEMAPSGPESFWVDGQGQIYICDSVNEQVKKLSPAGKLIGQQAIGFAGNDLAVDDNGEMFVLDRSRWVVEQIGANGQQHGVLQLERQQVETAFNLRVAGGQVLLGSVQQSEAVLGQLQAGKTVLRSAIAAATPGSGVKGLTEQRFRTLRNPRHRAEIDVLDSSEEVLDRLLLPVERVASVVFLGEDKAGNSYFQLETSDSDRGVKLSVYCLDKARNLDTVIENLPNDYYVWTAKLLQVSDSGDVYQVLPTREAVQVNVWQRHQTRAP
jgi:hypothetical protein